MSQVDLALEAGISSRHLSCIETGKAQPSREVIARLAGALEMPLREHNALLTAAGYAPRYPESGLGTPELTHVRGAIDLIVEHQEPFPAFVLNRLWDVLATNRAADRIARFLLGAPTAHTNMLRQFFDPEDLRAVVVNWEEMAGALIRHLHDEVAATPGDAQGRALLDELLTHPGVPAHWRTREPGTAPPLLLIVVFRAHGHELRFFSGVTRFRTPGDVTLDELRIECAFPADEATAQLCRTLAREDFGGTSIA